MPMGRYLREHPTLKYFFFGGKGGVGKTVFARAAAIGFARQGRRTLLVSTNPVHSLTSLFGQDMLGKHVAMMACPTLGLRDRHPPEHRAQQAGDPREDPLVSQVRRHHHQG